MSYKNKNSRKCTFKYNGLEDGATIAPRYKNYVTCQAKKYPLNPLNHPTTDPSTTV
jgi:hypothetical protein